MRQGRGAHFAGRILFCAFSGNGGMKRLLLASITAYQRWLSPIKGFSCAYRVHVGGESCSAYGYRVIERYGIGYGLRLIKRRLDKCSRQHRLHTGSRVGQHKTHPSKLRSQAGFCDVSCDGCDVGAIGLDSCDLIGGACNVVDTCGSCDFGWWGRSRKNDEEKWVTIDSNPRQRRSAK